MFEIFSEVAIALKRNKLRTFLTGFSIAWGIFMLIILLAAGNGLKNGVTGNFKSNTKNKVTIWTGWTSKPYKGKPKWRSIQFDREDSVMIAFAMSEVDQIALSYELYGKNIQYQKKRVNSSISAVTANYMEFGDVKILKGRFINELDIKEQRKVIVLADKDALILFGDDDPIGKQVICDNIVYAVVGIHKAGSRWQNESYFPFSTSMAIYNPAGKMRQIIVTVKGLETIEANEVFSAKLRQSMSRKHEFDPEDSNAIHIWNTLRDYMQTMTIFNAITLFVWIIGIGTLIAGIVGVSNIMLITVRERTKEFGIHKALGAKPISILRQIILESLLITSLFGYIGMLFGIALTELINKMLESSGAGATGEFKMFANPTVDLRIALSAMFILIIAGILAGYFPAKRAVGIKPIEALRYE